MFLSQGSILVAEFCNHAMDIGLSVHTKVVVLTLWNSVVYRWDVLIVLKGAVFLVQIKLIINSPLAGVVHNDHATNNAIA